MFGLENYQLLLVGTFFAGYLCIVLEHLFKVNKAAVALVVAVVSWGITIYAHPSAFHLLEEHLGQVSQIIFFLLGAMAIVEVIDSHHGFSVITKYLKTHSRCKLLWMVAGAAFFLSGVLDNLTTTIVMISMLRKILTDQGDRWLFGSIVVIAANAGGAWTPIGDVTTTMLWINGQLTAASVMKTLFLPSLVSVIASLVYPTYLLIKEKRELVPVEGVKEIAPHGTLVFGIGLSALVAVPMLKTFFHLPPFMGILVGLGVLWLTTDLLHFHDKDRDHLRLPEIMRKIDVSSVLFFLGILLAISSLESVGLLKSFATWINQQMPYEGVIAALIGLASAVIDNVPLVAACMGMYDLTVYATDSSFWHLIAYCAGTGGSILIIGSAAGVALMGLENVDFFWYMRRISLTAAIGYFAGFATYLLLSFF